jgi:hypothetical protein
MYYLILLFLHARPDHVAFNSDIQYAVPLWKEEVKGHVEHPFLVLVHGGSRKGVWYCFPDHLPRIPADVVALTFKLLNPDRRVVFLSCNKAAIQLHVPGVLYATNIIWCEPGDSVRLMEADWWFRGGKVYIEPEHYEVGVGRINLFHELPTRLPSSGPSRHAAASDGFNHQLIRFSISAACECVLMALVHRHPFVDQLTLLYVPELDQHPDIAGLCVDLEDTRLVSSGIPPFVRDDNGEASRD